MSQRTRYTPDPMRPVFLRYAMAMTITAWVLLIIRPIAGIPMDHPFGILLGAVALSAWYGGMGPGLLAATVGILAGMVLPSPMGVVFFSPSHYLQIGVYVVAAIAIGALADRRDTAEAHIRASRDELDAVLWCVADGVCAVDADGEIVYSNEAAERSGAILTALIGGAAGAGVELLDESGAPLPREELPVRRVLAGGENADGAVCIRGADGVERWFLVRASAVRGEGLGNRLVVCVMHDFSSRKRAEAERAGLLAAEQEARQVAEQAASRLERLQAVSSALSHALIPEHVADTVIRESMAALGACQGLLYTLDEGAEEMILANTSGCSEESRMEWARVPTSLRGPVADAARQRDIVWMASQREFCEMYTEFSEKTLLDSEGTRVAAPLIADGRCLGVLYLAFNHIWVNRDDDTAFLRALCQQCAQALDRARLYDVERAARAEAEQTARAMDEFLAMLGHELRNPLGAVMNAATLLGYLRSHDPELAEPLEVLDVETRQMKRLVNDLLDVSRITRGRIDLVVKPVDLERVVDQAVRCIQPVLDDRGQRLCEFRCAGPLIVLADAARLEQVIGNLLSNAAKFSDLGGRIDLELMREGEQAVICVRDYGIGIEPEFVSRVFDLFAQADRSLDRSGGGLGIGLTLVRRLVEMQGGSVEVRSAGIGHGSEFMVRLPMHADDGVSLGPAAGPRVAEVIPQRILIVDDNVLSGRLLSTLLCESGYEARCVGDGESALQAASEFQPDAVLLDLGLPGMDGFEVARRLRQEEGPCAPRLIAITGYGQREDLERTRSAGFNGHLTKPVDLDTLLQTLRDGVAGPASPLA